MANTNNDIITIVTVVFNGEEFIEDTIKSVINQTYAHIEYIIVDGGSNDRTVDIIKKYEKNISYWISEPDKGIYDAMNKAIEKASGKWINFMNAGDYFYSDRVVEDIFSANYNLSPYDVVYGDAEFRLKNIAYINHSAEHVDSNGFMPFSHQAVFVRTEIAKANKFDRKYRITADTAFFLRLIKEERKFRRVPIVVCSYDAQQGLSVDNEINRSQELIDMQVEYNGVDKNTPYFKKYIRNARLKQAVRKLLPASLWIALREKNIRKTKGNDIRYI